MPADWVFEDDGHSGATLVRPALEALRDLVAGVGVDVVLCYSPDRLARKFAYQALLIEEFSRAGTRVEFVKGPRGDSPEDQLLVQFQGMFAEYEKAQILERYRRGKAHRARAGSVNVLSGAPFGYRYLRKSDHAGAAYEIVEHEAMLVAELFRRYTDEAASIADLARWLTEQAVPTRTGKHRWDRSVIWAMLRNPAYAGRRGVRQDHHRGRVARTEPRRPPAGADHPPRGQDRRSAANRMDEIPVPAIVSEDTFERAQHRLADNKRFAARNTKVPSLLTGPGCLRRLRVRLLPHLDPHHQQADLLLPVPGLRRLPVRGRSGLRQPTGPRRLPRPGRLGPHHRPARRPGADPRRNRQAARPGPHRRPGHRPAHPPRTGAHPGHRRDHRA